VEEVENVEERVEEVGDIIEMPMSERFRQRRDSRTDNDRPYTHSLQNYSYNR